MVTNQLVKISCKNNELMNISLVKKKKEIPALPLKHLKRMFGGTCQKLTSSMPGTLGRLHQTCRLCSPADVSKLGPKGQTRPAAHFGTTHRLRMVS